MNKRFLILVLVVLVLAVTGIIIAEEFNEGFKLEQGKNLINLSLEFNPIYVADLVKIYPEIAAVTYEENKQKLGYVNALGGVGENFIIYPNKVYEITTKKEVNLNLK